MGLHKTIEDDMKSALKRGDSVKLSVLRMLISSIKMSEIQKNIKELAEADIIQIIQKHSKQRKESIDQFTKGNRPDLAGKESNELKILESYLPEQLSEEELIAIIKKTMADTGAVTKNDIGKVMKGLAEKVAGRADGKTINQHIMRFLK